jgi:hypothetical protein
MNGIHESYDGYIDGDIVVPEMGLHGMQSVDEYLISGEVSAEVIFRLSGSIIWVVVE